MATLYETLAGVGERVLGGSINTYSAEARARYEKMLLNASVRRSLNSFSAAVVLFTAAAFALAFFAAFAACSVSGMDMALMISLLVAVPMALFVFVTLMKAPRSVYLSRMVEIEKYMPEVIPFAAAQTVTGGAGGLSTTFEYLAREGAYGALSDEFGNIIRDMRLKMSIVAALQRSADRVEAPTYRRFLGALIHQLRAGAEYSGPADKHPLTVALLKLAEDTRLQIVQRYERYNKRLEKHATIMVTLASVFPVIFVMLYLLGGASGFSIPIPPAAFAVMFVFLLPMLFVWQYLIMAKKEPVGVEIYEAGR